MSLSFPRVMPSAGAEAINFDIQRIDFATPETGGRTGTIGAGFPLWRMDLDLGSMGREEGDAWRAFISTMRGSGRTFFARDLKRPFPRSHPGGLGSFDGEANSWSINGTADILTLSLPSSAAGLHLSHCDLIGFAWGANRRTVARVVEPATYSGGSLSVSIEPPLPALVPSGATASVFGHEVVMRLVTGETKVGAETAAETQGGKVVALQDLRA